MSSSLYIGIDLGTSSVKAVCIDQTGSVISTSSTPLTIQHPQPRWSEQNPEDWWQATVASLSDLFTKIDAKNVAALGLSGQQHGAVLLDGDGKVLRPAILWNDTRCDQECKELEEYEEFRKITGNPAMPGFTAPKLMWVRRYEPEVFKQISKVLLPKDYLRYRLTDQFFSDASDSAGTLWLDVQKREWNARMLEICGLHEGQMPKVVEGSKAGGHLSAGVAKQLGMREGIPVAGGGGDNAAGAVGVGVVENGQAMLSLGTSGVFFVVSNDFRAKPEAAVHSFCHSLPAKWHLMSVMLNSATCLDFVARLTGASSVGALLEEAERRGLEREGPIFLPYLTGERTPHNDAHAKGSFTGLGPKTDRAALTNSAMEGVGLGLLDGLLAVESTGICTQEITVIGGGSRSSYWVQMLADILGKKLVVREGSEVGPALGAARLARLAIDVGAKVNEVCPMPPIKGVHEPDMERNRYFKEIRHPLFKKTYVQLKETYEGER